MEQITIEEITEVIEETTESGFKKYSKIGVSIGASIFIGFIAYKYIGKPLLAKIKNEKEIFESVEPENVSNIEE